MKQTVEAIKRQFEALSAKIDPASAEMLQDRAYAMQLADCVAKTYVMLNNGMCEELEVCHTCAQQRDYLRDAMERFESVGQTGETNKETEAFYFEFIDRLKGIRENIDGVLAQL
ncbi:MAG: hypothetical protein P8Y65_03745 [Campylobacterales bacterium]|jgi:hypothetical protein